MSTELDNLEELLHQLGKERGALPFSKLYSFSDLAGARWNDFRSAWDAFPAPQRRRFVNALVELAEASFEVNFDTIFRHCLADPDDNVRAAAIDGLWENEDVALVGPLMGMLRKDPSSQVRAAAATGLGRYVLAGELEKLDPAVEARIMTELLTTIHNPDESIEVRRRAVESAAYACMPEVIEAIEIAYYDEDSNMRLSAVVGMGRSCDRRWRDIILEELESSSPAMRYEAALASGGLVLHQAVPTLIGLLDDADPEVRDATIWALGQIGGQQAKEALLAAYDDADEYTQSILDEALAEQAFLAGDVDFMLYELDEDYPEDLEDDDFFTLWSDDDEEGDETALEDWDL
jgi:hypothetical protein